jgi:hypothetical protein
MSIVQLMNSYRKSNDLQGRTKLIMGLMKQHGKPVTYNQARKIAKQQMRDDVPYEVFGDYLVKVRHGEKADQIVLNPDWMGQCSWLSIKHKENKPHSDWATFQAMKNHFCGPEREAVMLYPGESRLVDMADQYHVFVLPEGCVMPFGWLGRMATVDTQTEGAQP